MQKTTEDVLYVINYYRTVLLYYCYIALLFLLPSVVYRVAQKVSFYQIFKKIVLNRIKDFQ